LEFDWIAFLRLILLNSNWMANPKLNWTKGFFATEFAKSQLKSKLATELKCWTYPPAESPKTTEFAFLRLKLTKTKLTAESTCWMKKNGLDWFGLFQLMILRNSTAVDNNVYNQWLRFGNWIEKSRIFCYFYDWKIKGSAVLVATESYTSRSLPFEKTFTVKKLTSKNSNFTFKTRWRIKRWLNSWVENQIG
jgi:hypothetical protein